MQTDRQTNIQKDVQINTNTKRTKDRQSQIVTEAKNAQQ